VAEGQITKVAGAKNLQNREGKGGKESVEQSKEGGQRNTNRDKDRLKNRQNMEGILMRNLLSLCEFLKQYL
jgi:hypothetical protein